MVAALRLSKNGYGTVPEILKWPSDMVIDALEYENFLIDLESAFIELNKDGK